MGGWWCVWCLGLQDVRHCESVLTSTLHLIEFHRREVAEAEGRLLGTKAALSSTLTSGRAAVADAVVMAAVGAANSAATAAEALVADLKARCALPFGMPGGLQPEGHSALPELRAAVARFEDLCGASVAAVTQAVTVRCVSDMSCRTTPCLCTLTLRAISVSYFVFGSAVADAEVSQLRGSVKSSEEALRDLWPVAGALFARMRANSACVQLFLTSLLHPHTLHHPPYLSLA